jgi:hypothetical protein
MKVPTCILKWDAEYTALPEDIVNLQCQRAVCPSRIFSLVWMDIHVLRGLI